VVDNEFKEIIDPKEIQDAENENDEFERIQREEKLKKNTLVDPGY
jgi:hypothetical protein